MYKPLADEASTPVAQPVATAAPVVNSSAVSYSSSNEPLLRSHVEIPPQTCQVVSQTILTILCTLLGIAAVVLEVIAAGQEVDYADDFVYGLAVGCFIPAFIISCIAVPILCQTICVNRFGQNVLDLNSSLSCQVTVLTTAMSFSIFVDGAASILAFGFNTNTTAGIIYAGFLGAMALFNFIGAILGCAATCSSSCGACCNCQACCVTTPFDYRRGRPNQLGFGHEGQISVTSSMRSYGAYQTTPH